MVNNTPLLDRSFLALAHPVRREIVERLAAGSLTVGQATSGAGITKPAVTKHLKILEEAGIIVRQVEGRTHRLSLDERPLAQARGWLDRQRTLWEAKFDVIERYLAETTQRKEPMIPPGTSALQLTRRFAAPPDRVFDAWTNPEVLRRWWAAQPNWDSPVAEIDLRPGGRYRLAMRDTDTDHVHPVVGEFLAVERPHRLVYSWTWEGAPPEMDGSAGSTVTVTFRPTVDGTEVVLDHTGFATDTIRDRHIGGWTGCLDNLERRVFV